MPKNLFIRDGKWWARIWHNGREHRRNLQTASEKAAIRKLAALRAEIEAAPDHEATVSFARAAVEWDRTYLRGLKPRTADRYRESLRKLDPIFGDAMVDQITPRLVGAFVSARAAEGVTNHTIKNDLTALSGIIRVCIANGWLDTNPLAAWDRRVLKHRPKEQRPPGDASVALAAAYSRTPGKRHLVAFLRATGARLSEAKLLRWSEVDMAAGRITLLETKRGQPRVIRMTTPGGDARPVLEAVERHPVAPWVFWHGDGAAFSQASRGLYDLTTRAARLEREAGREFAHFRTHDLRHAFAIAWLNAGGDIYALSRHLGHTSVKTTEQFYLRWMDPAARDAFEAGNRHQTGTAPPVQRLEPGGDDHEGVEG